MIQSDIVKQAIKKKCVSCGIEKELDEFAIANGKIRGVCRQCVSERVREIYKNNPEKCKARAKLYREKNKEKVAKSKKKWQQTEKAKAYARIYNQKPENKDRYRKLQWKRKYGLDPIHAQKILTSQNNKCAICGDELTKPYVDHCHKTQAIRGILCLNCNTGIGMFNDSPKLLIAAFKYLEKNGNFTVENHRILPSGAVV